jgi:hypothetical protein
MTEVTGGAPVTEATVRWHPATVVVFRACVVYFALYVLVTQMLQALIPLPGTEIPELGSLPPARNLIIWVGHRLLGIHGPISYANTGSGDRAFDWSGAFTVLLVTAIVTAAWCGVRGVRRRHPQRLYRWFRLFIRFALGTSMLVYGLFKVVPLQMSAPSLTRLLEPYGHFSPMGVLWSSIGAAPGYEIFVGSAEVAAALLLFVPRTALIGAFLGLMDAVAVFTLNMTYDVPVKLFSFHLILMSVFLIAPSAGPLFDLFLRGRSARLPGEPSVAGTPRRRRAALIAQVAFGTYALAVGLFGDAQAWRQFGGGAPKSALYGIWEVDQMTADGALLPPLLSDSVRWRRVIFERPTFVRVQAMNDTLTFYRATIDTAARTLTLTMPDSATAPLSFARPTPERLVIDGTLHARVIRVELSLRTADSFPLRSRGFNWIQEYPFNQ